MVEMEKDITNMLSNIPIDAKSEKPMKNGKFSIEDYAITFIYGMGKTQRERFKKMLDNGIKCGESVALNYNIEYEPFINEVKRILNVEE